jgi:transposase
VIHPNSIAVSREHRRAKTDRLDTGLLKRSFLGWLRGEREHRSMAAIPSLEEEDAKWPSRERENLVGERTRIGNRIKSTLARLGVRGFKPTLRTAAQRLERRPTPEGDPVPPNTLAELRRETARLCLLADQIREIETARLQRLEQRPNCGAHPMVRLLARGSGSWHRDCRPPTRRSRAACATAGGGALWRSDRLAGRERGAPAGERTGQACPWQRTRGRQCPGAGTA